MLEDRFGSALVIILTRQLSLKDFGKNNRNIQKVKICYSNSAVFFFFLKMNISLLSIYWSITRYMVWVAWIVASAFYMFCWKPLLSTAQELWHFVIFKCKSINVTSTCHFNGLALPFIPSLWASLNFFLPTGFYMCYVPCGTFHHPVIPIDLANLKFTLAFVS